MRCDAIAAILACCVFWAAFLTLVLIIKSFG